MGSANLIPRVKDNDWTSVRQAISKLASSALGPTSSPTFAGITLSGLTASLLVQTDSSKAMASVSDLTSWIAGTANQVAVADDSDGTVTLSTPQDIHTAASPTFAGITIFDPTPILVFKDSNSTGDAAVGFIEWRDSNNTRLGCFGNTSSGNDKLLWKNESGGHIQVQTTGAGEFQIFANTVANNNSITGIGALGAGNLTIDT